MCTPQACYIHALFKALPSTNSEHWKDRELDRKADNQKNITDNVLV